MVCFSKFVKHHHHYQLHILFSIQSLSYAHAMLTTQAMLTGCMCARIYWDDKRM